MKFPERRNSETETGLVRTPTGLDEGTETVSALVDARFLTAVAVLVINDQFLKAAFGNWFTGKLSDVAGLVVLPVIIGVVLDRLGQRRWTNSAWLALGLWFGAMKIFSPVAHATEAIFETLTQRPSTIVVDPTDLVGLSGFVVAAFIVRRPRPLLTKSHLRYLSLAFAAFACAATSGPEYYETDLGIMEESGEVLEISSLSNIDSLETSGFDQRETEACIEADPNGTCFRIVDSRIERRTESGDWELVWLAHDVGAVRAAVHGGWGPASISANDIIAAPDGTVHVGFFDEFGPVTRSTDGTWNPAFHQFRPLGWLIVVYLGLAAAAVAMATKVQYIGGVTFALAVLLAGTVAIYWSGGLLGLEFLTGLVLAVTAVVLAASALVMARRRRARLNWRRAAPGVVGMALGLLAAVYWKYVLTSPPWLYWVALVPAFGGAIGGFLVKHPPPPPPTGDAAV